MENLIIVAKILKPQGIRGEVKVKTYTDDPTVLDAFTKLYIGGNEYKLLKVRPQNGDNAFLTLSQIADRNAAELLRGLDVFALKSELPVLDGDTFYIGDVLGCELCGKAGNVLGVVTKITPARTDVYEYQTTGGKTVVFAAVKGVIVDVDVENKRVTVDEERLAEVALES